MTNYILHRALKIKKKSFHMFYRLNYVMVYINEGSPIFLLVQLQWKAVKYYIQYIIGL